MTIQAMKIDGIEYDVVRTDSIYKCYECDCYDMGEWECSFEKETPDFVCPLVNQSKKAILKRRPPSSLGNKILP